MEGVSKVQECLEVEVTKKEVVNIIHLVLCGVVAYVRRKRYAQLQRCTYICQIGVMVTPSPTQNTQATKIGG